MKCLFWKYCATFTQSVYTYGRNESSCNKLYFARCFRWISARANGRITREEQRQHSLRARYFKFAIIMAFLVKLSISQVIYVDCSSRRASTPLPLYLCIYFVSSLSLSDRNFLHWNCSWIMYWVWILSISPTSYVLRRLLIYDISSNRSLKDSLGKKDFLNVFLLLMISKADLISSCSMLRISMYATLYFNP